VADPGAEPAGGRLALPALFLAVASLTGALGPLDAAPAFLALALGMAGWALASGRGPIALLPVLAGLPAIAAVTGTEPRLGLLALVALATPSRARAAGAAFVAGALAWRIAIARLPGLWMASVGASRSVSHAVGVAARRPLDLGPSASGLDLLILLAIALAAARPGGRRGAWRRGIAGAVATLAFMAWVGSSVPARAGLPLDAPAVFNLAHEHLAPARSEVARAMLGWLPVLCLVMACLLAGRPRHRRVSTSRPRAATAFVAAAVLGAALIAPMRAAPARRDGELLLLKSPAFDLEVPRTGRHGIANAGMFGLFARYLALDGHRTRVHTGPITQEALDAARVVIMAVPTMPPDTAGARLLERFVERGGSLLVLSDHTDLLGTMRAGNALTGRWGMRARFDSAYPAVREWAGCLDGFGIPVTGRAGIGTGASLDVRPPARPLIIGRYALSDRGDRSNGGRGAWLGDYSYEPGEQLGDLPVAAIARPGSGRVVMFGDTSSFQNVVLPFSYPFVADLLDRLSRPAVVRAGRVDACVGTLAVVLGLLAIAGSRTAAAGLAAGVTLSAIVLSLSAGPGPLQRLAAGAPVAIVDGAHLNRYATRLWEERSIGGLIVNLQRSGYLPVISESRLHGRIDPAALVVILAPRVPLGSEEVDALAAHLERGGTVLVAAGSGQSGPVSGLLERYGLSIGTMPLGPVPIAADMDRAAFEQARRRPQFRAAWPVLSSGLVPTRPLYRGFGRPIVVEAAIEGAGGRRGRLLVIADPDFLTDRVLENETDAWEGNTALLARMLAPDGGS